MTPTMRADAARNRERVLATARLAAAEGDLSLQLNDIARRAGVGVGTVYRHFPTRRALVEGLAEEAFTTLLAHARTASRRDDAWQGVTELLRALLAGQLADPAFAEVISTGPDLDAAPATTAHRDEFGTLAHALLQRARSEGLLRADLTDEDLRHLVCGTAFALRIGEAPAERIDRYLEVLLSGLRAAQRGASSRATDM